MIDLFLSPAPIGDVQPVYALLGSIISAGASLLGGVLANKQSKANVESANAFTTEQLQNRHQWEVEDLQKAGLNPVLSAHGTPSIGGSPVADVHELSGPTVNSAMAARRLSEELKNMRETNKNIQADTNLKKDQAVVARSSALLNSASARSVAINNVLDALRGPGAAVDASWNSSKVGQFMEALRRGTGSAGAAIGGFFGGIGSAFKRSNPIGFRLNNR